MSLPNEGGRGRFNGRAAFRIALAADAAFVTVGALVFHQYREAQFAQRPAVIESFESFDPDQLLAGIDLSTNEAISRAAADLTTSSYSIAARFKENSSGVIKTQVRQEARDHVLKEAAFHRRYRGLGLDVKFIDKKTFQINGVEYGADDPTDVFLADAIFEVGNDAVTQRLPRRFDSSFSKDAISLLEYLKSRVKIELDDSTFGNARGLLSTARVLRLLEEKREIIHPVLSSSAFLKDIASYYIEHDQSLFTDYQELMNRLLPNEDSTSSNQYQERFSSNFDLYVNNGNSFRGQILYQRKVGDKRLVSTWQQEYDFLKAFFGREFSINGKVKEIEQYQVGNFVVIDDPTEKDNPQFRGVIFRPRPVLDKDPSWPYTVDGRVVRLEDGPVAVLDGNQKTAVEMWMGTEVGRAYTSGDSWQIRENSSDGGWFPGTYLGRKVDPEKGGEAGVG